MTAKHNTYLRCDGRQVDGTFCYRLSEEFYWHGSRHIRSLRRKMREYGWRQVRHAGQLLDLCPTCYRRWKGALE